jgi:hypothetical protein
MLSKKSETCQVTPRARMLGRSIERPARSRGR